MMDQVTSVMIVGVGGQGSLLASRLLGHVLLEAGYDVKVSEVHGMSQRGGSVVTYVRYGKKVASPVIEQGEADVIVSFELCEAARWLPYLRKGGKLIASSQRIDPMPVSTGAASYPEAIPQTFQALGVDATVVDALALAEQAGNAKAANVVLMGVLSQHLEFPLEAWQEAIRQLVKPAFVEMNQQALLLGRAAQ